MISERSIAAIRFGYGLPLPKGAPTTPDQMLAALAGPDVMAAAWPIAGSAEIQPLLAQLADENRAGKAQGKETAAFLELQEQLFAMPAPAMRSTLARALDGADGFRERLVTFWADHFTVTRKLKYHVMMPFALVEDAIRPNLAGSFGDLLTAVTLHPAMLAYLDQTSSIGPNSDLGKRRGKGLNENLARELLELHSLGVGAGYTQDDVRQMAELLTGLTYEQKRGMVFDPNRAEPGPETVLGQTYSGTGLQPIREALAALAVRPETAAHLARKLAVHFVSDAPDPTMVASIEAAYLASDGDLLASYGAMLAHPSAWAAPLQKVRQPYDFLIAALRALGMDGAAIMALDKKAIAGYIERPMRKMGQPFQQALGPNGWPEAAESWITPQGLAQRISWAMTVPGNLVRPLPDPVTFVQQALGDQAGADLIWAVEKAEDQRQGIGLVLASADFNRR